MTLDEQITFMEELLDDDDHWSCENAKSEYRQLLEWLKDYKRLLEMSKGDLISREALKSALKSNCTPEICHDYGTNWCEICCPHNDFEDLIDNAPTVEAYTGTDLIEENKKGFNTAKRLYERPQGEWIKEPNGKTTDIYRCSICGRSILLCKNADLSKYPFCHCGAKMKGGAEE